MKIPLERCEKDGLYLCCANNDIIDLSTDVIRNSAETWWNSPSKIPRHVRQDEHFKTCTVCPYRDQPVLCSAMKPLLPLLERIDEFFSYDKVDAVYVREGVRAVIPCVDMQYALQSVVNLSLFEYCEHTKRYLRLVEGVTPFMEMEETARRIFLNAYFLCSGSSSAASRMIQRMIEETLVVTKSCVKRLNVLCAKDAFMNAYVSTQAVIGYVMQRLDSYSECQVRA